MLKEFKEFAMKGSLLDIAVGFVMGAAFGQLVTSFTEGIVSPLIGMIFQADFSALKWVLKPAEMAEGVETAAEVAVMYGSFLTNVINFLIVAFVMFMIVKGVNKMKKAEEAGPPPPPPANEVLLTEIRDLLKKK